eukprot:m.9348 g.9348  ORF g.9348 m.9348 type:complete len:335 (-) comp7178_c0_seq1:115-1119(-)
MATTCLSPPPTCPGTRAGSARRRSKSSPARPSWKLSTPSCLRPVPPTSPSVFPSKTSTKLAVSVLCPSVVSRPVSSSPVWLSPLPPPWSPLRSSLWRCTTNSSLRPNPVTTLASTSRTSPSRTSAVVWSAVTPRTILPKALPTSPAKSLSSTTLVKSPTVIPPSWIATLPTLPASLLTSRRRLIAVPVRRSRTTPSLSSLVMPLLLSWSPKSPCASRLSPNTPLLDVLPSVTCDKPLPSVSSRPSRRLRRLARPQRALPRRSKFPTSATTHNPPPRVRVVMANIPPPMFNTSAPCLPNALLFCLCVSLVIAQMGNVFLLDSWLYFLFDFFHQKA